MKKLFFVFAILFLGFVFIIPNNIESFAWKSDKNPGYNGDFKSNERLKNLDFIPLNQYIGPEDLYIDSLGLVYTGVEGGAILQINPKTQEIKELANTGGRPLSISAGYNKNFYLTDAHSGLLELDSMGNVSVLLDEYNGRKMFFTNSLAVGKNGEIFFTLSTTKKMPKESDPLLASTLILLEHKSDGMLMSYNTQTKQTKVLISDLVFPNGLALSQDEDFLLFNETAKYQVSKFYLEGERKGKREIVLSNLPAFPDNIKRYKDKYLVGLVSPRDPLLDWVSNLPKLKNQMAKIPPSFLPKSKKYGHLLMIDENGRVLQDYQDPSGNEHHITGAFGFGNRIYLSNLNNNRLSYFDIE